MTKHRTEKKYARQFLHPEPDGELLPSPPAVGPEGHEWMKIIWVSKNIDIAK
jgi:hypothetical protein